MTLSIKEFRETAKALKYWLGASIALNFIVLCAILLVWNAGGDKTDIDALAVSITALEIILAIVAVGGFWTLKGAARERAEEVAREVAEKEARDVAVPTARRAAEDFLNSKEDAKKAKSDIEDLVSAIGDEREGRDA